MNTLLLLALFLIGSLAAQTAILWVAARVCRLPCRNWGRALLISLSRLLVVVGLWIALVGRDGDPAMSPAFWIAALIGDVFLTLVLVRVAFGGTLRRVLGTWAVQLLLAVFAGAALGVLMQTCLTAYVIPTSSMSPNFRGYHVVEVLSDGKRLIVAANDPAGPRGILPGEPSGGIVAETFEYREVPRPARYTAQADRILCNKTMLPSRWDAVVHRHPDYPDAKHVKRLVGLPGETIEVRDGAVWINGERQSPPARLGPIRYLGDFVPEGEPPPLGPVTLGADEYFVLGDNPNKSVDSRTHGPVKGEFIEGVADLIYWPPARWRSRP